jgi:hypothetical protein
MLKKKTLMRSTVFLAGDPASLQAALSSVEAQKMQFDSHCVSRPEKSCMSLCLIAPRRISKTNIE